MLLLHNKKSHSKLFIFNLSIEARLYNLTLLGCVAHELKHLPILRAIALAEDTSLAPRLFMSVFDGRDVPYSFTISIRTKLLNLPFMIEAIYFAIEMLPSPILKIFFVEIIPDNKTDISCITESGEDSTILAISL